MDPERWRRIEELFLGAADLPAEQRSAFVERECAGDRSLEAEVRKLLDADAGTAIKSEEFVSLASSSDRDPMIGRRLGVYQLTSRVAVGGMGVVYRAERADGLFQQEVAIKLLRMETASEGMLRRFDFERRTLAALQHPNIASLLHGGASRDGIPYLIMEFIHGEPIDRFCMQQRLAIRDRLRLFVTVCRAVQFAHQNLIVHRDLKPANVFVDNHGVVKLLDFGIARLLDTPDTTAELTRPSARVLTPEYASPEQLKGEPLTTATDVYSLGVVLYGLLTGTRPFRSESRSAGEWERIVTENMPTRPSSAVLRRPDCESEGSSGEATAEEFASGCRSTTTRLHRRLRGDLDRIVLMALRKEPDRRYASVQQFADDLEHYLAGQPIQARSDSVFYRASKFVGRNRIGVAATALVALALLVGSIAAWSAERHATAEAHHAQIEASSFRTIADFVTEAFLASDAFEDPSIRSRIEFTLERHARQVRRQFDDQPHLQANLLDGLGRVVLQLGNTAMAESLVQEAHAVRHEVFGAHNLEVALSLGILGEIDYRQGRFQAAAEKFERALDMHRTCEVGVHTDVAMAANNLAVAYRNLGRMEDSETLHREALRLRRAADERSTFVAESLNNLAGIHLHRGEFAEAIELLSEAREIRGELLGSGHPLTLQSISNLAIAKSQDHEAEEEAYELFQLAADGYRELREAGRSDLAHVLSQVGSHCIQTSEWMEAQDALEEALELLRELHGAGHPRVASSLAKLAIVQHQRQQDAEAAESWREVLKVYQSTLHPADPLIGGAYRDYGVFLCDTGQLQEAEQALVRAVEILSQSSSPSKRELGAAEAALARCLTDQGRNQEARAPLQRGLQRLTEFLGPEDQMVRELREGLARTILEDTGN